MMHARHSIIIILCSVAFFLFCDNLIFRSGLYDRIADPEPLAGQLYNAVHYEKIRPASGKQEILLIGNSRIHWGFWAKLFSDEHPKSNIEFEQLGIAGTYEKIWYYILKAVDPDHNRYAAIVIPTDGYKVDSWRADQENSYDNVSMLSSIMSPMDWPSFWSSFSDAEIRHRAIIAAIFSGHSYAGDIQDLILHPSRRIERLSLRKAAGARWLYDWAGSEGSMETLQLDEKGMPLVFPEQLNSFEKQEVKDELTSPTTEQAEKYVRINTSYKVFWLNKIISLYKNSKTKLIFIQMPRWPFPLPARTRNASAPDLRNLLARNPNVTFIDENAFVPLEQKSLFHDALHLNNIGRRKFTESLGDRILRLISPQAE